MLSACTVSHNAMLFTWPSISKMMNEHIVTSDMIFTRRTAYYHTTLHIVYTEHIFSIKSQDVQFLSKCEFLKKFAVKIRELNVCNTASQNAMLLTWPHISSMTIGPEVTSDMIFNYRIYIACKKKKNYSICVPY